MAEAAEFHYCIILIQDVQASIVEQGEYGAQGKVLERCWGEVKI